MLIRIFPFPCFPIYRSKNHIFPMLLYNTQKLSHPYFQTQFGNICGSREVTSLAGYGVEPRFPKNLQNIKTIAFRIQTTHIFKRSLEIYVGQGRSPPLRGEGWNPVFPKTYLLTYLLARQHSFQTQLSCCGKRCSPVCRTDIDVTAARGNEFKW